MRRILIFLLLTTAAASAATVRGRVLDPQGKPVAGASVAFGDIKTASDEQGGFTLDVTAGTCEATIAAPGFVAATKTVTVGDAPVELRFEKLAERRESVVVSANAGATVDFRSAIFARDDQMFQQLDSGIDAGQHEGGGKSLEIRRFGFNLDHGGVNGGLKVLVDDVQQNQGTQGHGQGYLGSLKSISPELIQDVTVIDGPFSAEYGDFSGLGVVHIRQRESMPDVLTLRAEGGQFDTARGFLAYSPDLPGVDSYVAYEGSYTNGPFENPLRYRRDNFNSNVTKHLGQEDSIGLRLLAARNDFYSSGQIPLDLVSEGLLDRFGYVDPTDGGRVRMATASAYYNHGSTFRVDGFVARSLFDLYSNFTYYLNDPVHGDAFQQHDSRLQEGVNTRYTRVHKLGVLVAGTNFHDNQINVGLYPREGRDPLGVTTRALAHVTNAAGFAQETVSLWRGRLLLSSGLRYDEFRYGVRDLVTPAQSGTEWAGRWQGKGSATVRPWANAPVGLHVNYGRGINSIDARGVVERPDQPRLATTDFYQAGASANVGRVSLSADAFVIRHSNEMVYIPDDGSFEFKGPSRAYGYEAKLSMPLTRHISLNAGVTKMLNAYYLGGGPRLYVNNAPHFVANAALTMAGWHGWSGSLRMRAINHYRLDGLDEQDTSVVASGHTVFDVGAARQIRRGVELNFSVDNALDRSYYETQNFFVSQVTPWALPVGRIHGTPGYPLTAVVGVTVRLRGK
jgi:TonB dependent receptor/Carboxypeptidase regulatory-like domain/TonB-dependent Receptor Plug Domain